MNSKPTNEEDLDISVESIRKGIAKWKQHVREEIKVFKADKLRYTIRYLNTQMDDFLLVLPKICKFIAGQILILLAFLGVTMVFPRIETWILANVVHVSTTASGNMYAQVGLSLAILFLFAYGLMFLITHTPKTDPEPMPPVVKKAIWLAAILALVLTAILYGLGILK